MGEFMSKWVDFSVKTPKYRGAKSAKRGKDRGFGTFGTDILELSGGKFGDGQAEVKARQEEALSHLLGRLKTGHTWLTRTHDELLKTQELHTKQEARFLEAIDLWDKLDGMIRGLYGYEHCIMGPGQRCPDESPISCRACVGSIREVADG